VKCKHPYQFNVTEMASFLGATDMGAFKPAFTLQKITGAMMTALSLEQLTDHLGGSLGDAMSFNEGREEGRFTVSVATCSAVQRTEPLMLQHVPRVDTYACVRASERAARVGCTCGCADVVLRCSITSAAE
jgi:hypothetical protein